MGVGGGVPSIKSVSKQTSISKLLFRLLGLDLNKHRESCLIFNTLQEVAHAATGRNEVNYGTNTSTNTPPCPPLHQ